MNPFLLSIYSWRAYYETRNETIEQTKQHSTAQHKFAKAHPAKKGFESDRQLEHNAETDHSPQNEQQDPAREILFFIYIYMFYMFWMRI